MPDSQYAVRTPGNPSHDLQLYAIRNYFGRGLGVAGLHNSRGTATIAGVPNRALSSSVNRVPQEARFSTSLCNEANELTALVNGLSHTRPEPSGLDIY